MQAYIANRLLSFIKNPLLGSPPGHAHRHVQRELDNVVLTHLHIIKRVWESRAAANTERSSGIRKVLTDVLGLLQKFLLQMDWNSPGRNLGGERVSYGQILEGIDQLRGDKYIYDPVMRTVGDALAATCKTSTCIMYSL